MTTGLRIAAVNVHVLEAPLTVPFHWSFNRTSQRASCLVEIVAENGLVGWGECYGPARPNAAIVAAFRSYLVGANALETERIWQTLYNQFRDTGQKGLTVTALSGVDIALWDLKGRHFEAPVHTLMGGALRRELRLTPQAPIAAMTVIRSTTSQRKCGVCARGVRRGEAQDRLRR